MVVQPLVRETHTSEKHLTKEKLGNKCLLTSLGGCVGSVAIGGKRALLRALDDVAFLENTY